MVLRRRAGRSPARLGEVFGDLLRLLGTGDGGPAPRLWSQRGKAADRRLRATLGLRPSIIRIEEATAMKRR
ncbi:hypothetical protein MTO96_007453 [Rhipicephalus appendiculatus]